MVKPTLKTTFFFIFFISFSHFGFSGCIPSEREALLEFKNKLKDPSNRLESWDNNDVNCCKWYGITCSNITGHVLKLHLQPRPIEEYFGFVRTLKIDYNQYYSNQYQKSRFRGEISSSLLGLKNLRYLDLSNNDFGGKPIPELIGSFSSLRFLNLSNSRFGGLIPHEIRNLSNLEYLNLNSEFGSNVGISPYVDTLDWISGLSSLEFLDLSFVDLSKVSNWFETIHKLPFLHELHLSNCYLDYHVPHIKKINSSSLSVLDLSHNSLGESLIRNLFFGLKRLESLDLSYNQFFGPIPNELRNVSSLRELDLSHNEFNSSIPEWLYGFHRLEILSLEYNSLRGQISSDIRNMTSLLSLDLSVNKFEGGIREPFKYLCNLKSLSFSSTKLGQEMDEILENLSGCALEQLESLDLSGCEVSGELNNQIVKFSGLTYLSLSANSLSGPIPLELRELVSLKYLFLDHNKLVGTIPFSLGNLSGLVVIGFSYNSFEGLVSDKHFANLTNLRKFDGSFNKLVLRVSSNWIPPFLHVQFLKLSQWEIGPEFPNWFRELKHVKVLDLSNSGISSSIPNWFWNSSFEFSYLNLSHNQIYGVIPDFGLTSLVIDLSSNHFKGLVPRVSSNTIALDISNNSFSGSISNFVCHKMDEEKKMLILDLDKNLLTGEIPNCWISWTSLSFLRLSNNNFSGSIPESIRNLTSLGFLHIRNNSLSGEIPSLLENCANLLTLDLGENSLTGRIPHSIWQKFPYLSILMLRANKLQGEIPRDICHLTSLQILDMSYNSLLGFIPDCIDNFSFMATTASPIRVFSSGSKAEDGVVATSTDQAVIMMKGRIAEYDRILEYVKIMDFSSNNLSGEIPKEVTRLRTLQSLNLSSNFLSGNIPEDIGDMKWLEVLDVSENRLSGQIPESVASLTFLSMLNVSYNKLSGRIPTGAQIQSFSGSSFTGNRGLTGPPLIENYTENGSVPRVGENLKGGSDGVDWGLYVSVAFGFIVGFWSVLCPLIVNRRWRHSYHMFFERLRNKWVAFRVV